MGEPHVILEFFSGIGGMRYAAQAWAERGPGERSVRVAASFEISEVCNRIYEHNFGDKPRTKSIEHLEPALLDSFGADTWLMSPPCQPYTSMGKQRDAQDPRARALLHLCEVIPRLSTPPSYILLENVNHFQHSQSHGLWLEAMTAAGFMCHEFLLSPAQIGIPNERLRYYCLARRLQPGEEGIARLELTSNITQRAPAQSRSHECGHGHRRLPSVWGWHKARSHNPTHTRTVH